MIEIEARIILIVLILRDCESRVLLRIVIQLLIIRIRKDLFYFSPVWSLIHNPLNKRIYLDAYLFNTTDIISLILNITRQLS